MKTKDFFLSGGAWSVRILASASLALWFGATGGSLLAAPFSPTPPRPLEHKGAEWMVELTALEREALLLPSETDIPAFSALMRAWNEQPKTTRLVSTTRQGVPARVAIHQVGRPSRERIVVCLHGFLGDYACWRRVAGALQGAYELWLVDLPGCGDSDAPDPGKLGPGGYSPAALADRVLQAMKVLLDERPEHPRLVLSGLSYGGMVTLRMFMDDALRRYHASVLTSVDGLILFAPGDVVLTRGPEAWYGILGLNGFKAWMGDFTGLLDQAVSQSVRSGCFDPSLACREVAEQGVRVLKTGPQRRALQAMMRDAIQWEVFGKRLDYEAAALLEAAYEQVRVPCLIVWGERDETLPLSMGYKMKDQIPNASLTVLVQSKHLLPMERPAACAELIRQFDSQLRAASLPPARSIRKLCPSPAITGPAFQPFSPAVSAQCQTGILPAGSPPVGLKGRQG